MDDEKRREYTFESVTSFGIKLWSRYNKIHELADLLLLTDTMHPHDRMCIKEMWIDSKACAVFNIEMHENLSKEKIIGIGNRINKILRYRPRGHNGVWLRSGNILEEIEPHPNEVAQ